MGCTICANLLVVLTKRVLKGLVQLCFTHIIATAMHVAWRQSHHTTITKLYLSKKMSNHIIAKKVKKKLACTTKASKKSQK